MLRHACGYALATEGMIRGHCKPILDTATSNIQCAIPSYPRHASRTSGGSDVRVGSNQRSVDEYGQRFKVVTITVLLARAARFRYCPPQRHTGGGCIRRGGRVCTATHCHRNFPADACPTCRWPVATTTTRTVARSTSRSARTRSGGVALLPELRKPSL
jgi:hypothetical protein